MSAVDESVERFILAEFQALRSELLTHFSFANALIGLQLTLVGVAAATASSGPIVGAVFSVLSSLVWLTYLDHIYAIVRIATYLSIDLRQRLGPEVGDQVFRWETWLRRLRNEGIRISAEDGGERLTERGSERRLGLNYPALLFGGSSSVGAIAFCYTVYLNWADYTSRATQSVIAAIGVIALILLAFSWSKFRRLSNFIARADAAITANSDISASSPEPHSG